MALLFLKRPASHRRGLDARASDPSEGLTFSEDITSRNSTFSTSIPNPEYHALYLKPQLPKPETLLQRNHGLNIPTPPLLLRQTILQHPPRQTPRAQRTQHLRRILSSRKRASGARKTGARASTTRSCGAGTSTDGVESRCCINRRAARGDHRSCISPHSSPLQYKENIGRVRLIPREQFALFDLDKDQRIDYHEFKVALKALGFDLPKPDILALLTTHGISPDAQAPPPPSQPGNQHLSRQAPPVAPGRLHLTLPAFQTIAAGLIAERDPRDEILRAFALFDTEDKGKITLEDLRRVARELGEGLEEEELIAMIEEFDLEGKGGVGREEFVGICMG